MPYHCSEFEKGKIIQLESEGRTVPQIAQEVGRTIKTNRKWLHRFEAEGEPGMKPREKINWYLKITLTYSISKRTTTVEQDQAMVEVSPASLMTVIVPLPFVIHGFFSASFSDVCVEMSPDLSL